MNSGLYRHHQHKHFLSVAAEIKSYLKNIPEEEILNCAISIFLVRGNGAIIQRGFDCVLFYGEICAPPYMLHVDTQFVPSRGDANKSDLTTYKSHILNKNKTNPSTIKSNWSYTKIQNFHIFYAGKTCVLQICRPKSKLLPN